MADMRKLKYKTKHATARQRAVAEALHAGAPIQATMLANGYSENVAAQGIYGVPKTSLTLLLEKSHPDLLEYSKLSPAEFKSLVLGRLGKNTADGRDGGVMSAKALGSIKELAMFQSESQVGIVVVQAPGTSEVALLTAGDKECEE